MLRRLSLLLRGPGVLALLLALAVVGTASARYHWLHWSQTNKRPAAIPTLVLPVYSVSISRNSGVRDPTTGMTATIRSVRIDFVQSTGRSGKAKPVLLVDIQLMNRGSKPAGYDYRNFYALAPSGETFAAESPSGLASGRALRSGSIAPGRTLRSTIAFALDSQSAPLTIIWSDDNRLIPPGMLGTLTIRVT